MTPKKTKDELKKAQDAEIVAVEEKSEMVNLNFDPETQIEHAQAAAKRLIDIVKQNKWSVSVGGPKEHLMYEAWQTLGKFYNLAVDTSEEAEPVQVGDVQGFKARAKVIDTVTGKTVGGAIAYCMRDEANWKAKPTFQLASMAQTRAGAKSLRQLLSFVVALAGYSPTPLEEMTGDEYKKNTYSDQPKSGYSGKVTDGQKKFIRDLLRQKGFSESQLLEKYEVGSIDDITFEQASQVITNLKNLPNRQYGE